MKFTEFELHPSVQAGVDGNQYVDCTPIQSATIPHILAGQDIAGLAQTGTGKTAAFVLPLIDRIVRSKENAAGVEPKANIEAESTENVGDESKENVVAEEDKPIFPNWKATNFILVLVPTRELAEQVHEQVKKLGGPAQMKSVAIYGGTGYEHQTKAIESGVDFIVATPGRLIDLYKEHQVDLAQVRAIVFDEADRMFDMGFKDDMKYILKRVPNDRQFLVFSATLNFDVLNTAYEFGANPIDVNVSRDQTKAENVEDEIFHVGQEDKNKYLVSILKKYQPKQAIIFSNFKREVGWLAQFLTKNGIPAMGISSLISQGQRSRIMEQFRKESNSHILVATDVAARGLDVKGVDMVINFQLPDDAENYVHRIGRTGRAGEKGRAFSLVSDRDVDSLQRIESYLGNKVTVGWMEESELVKDLVTVRNEESRPRHSEGHGGGRKEFSGRRDERTHGGGDHPKKHRYEDTTYYPKKKTEGAQGPTAAAKDPQAQPAPFGKNKHQGPPQARHHGKGQGQGQQGGGQSQGHSKHGKRRWSENKNRDQKYVPGKQSYKYTPKQGSSRSQPAKGVVGKVKGFLKKIFGA